MLNQQTLQGNWNEIKGKLQSKWGTLTDDDIAIFNGNVDQLVGTIQRKTGEARASIELAEAQQQIQLLTQPHLPQSEKEAQPHSDPMALAGA